MSDRTLVLLKPDCVQRRLMGKVLSRFEEKGLNVIGLKMLQVTPQLAEHTGVIGGWAKGGYNFGVGHPVATILADAGRVPSAARLRGR